MMTGCGRPVGNAGGFGRIGTTLAGGAGGWVRAIGRRADSTPALSPFGSIGRGALEGGWELRTRGGGIFGAAIDMPGSTLRSWENDPGGYVTGTGDRVTLRVSWWHLERPVGERGGVSVIH
jgi:hypothetical protein